MALARPTPYSWSVGDTITVPILNGIRDALTWGQNVPLFVGYQSTVQSIPNNSWTAISLDTNYVDTYTGHSTTTNPSRYTCQSGAAGYYTVSGVYASASSSANFRGVRIALNGAALLGGAVYSAPSAAGEMGVATPTRDVFLNVGDFVEIQAYQSTGGALNTQLDVDLRCMMAVRWSHA